jgi:hypothetical protein
LKERGGKESVIPYVNPLAVLVAIPIAALVVGLMIKGLVRAINELGRIEQQINDV